MHDWPVTARVWALVWDADVFWPTAPTTQRAMGTPRPHSGWEVECRDPVADRSYPDLRGGIYVERAGNGCFLSRCQGPSWNMRIEALPAFISYPPAQIAIVSTQVQEFRLQARFSARNRAALSCRNNLFYRKIQTHHDAALLGDVDLHSKWDDHGT
ncbi:hypothetical protein AcV7_009782 [Taiwanofungus camphoratus]|nr:hypothetical protein AcV7_009782 [Antrodia cinnamomea]